MSSQRFHVEGWRSLREQSQPDRSRQSSNVNHSVLHQRSAMAKQNVQITGIRSRRGERIQSLESSGMKGGTPRSSRRDDAVGPFSRSLEHARAISGGVCVHPSPNAADAIEHQPLIQGRYGCSFRADQHERTVETKTRATIAKSHLKCSNATSILLAGPSNSSIKRMSPIHRLTADAAQLQWSAIDSAARSAKRATTT